MNLGAFFGKLFGFGGGGTVGSTVGPSSTTVSDPPFADERSWLDDQIRVYGQQRVILTPLRDSVTNPTQETWEMRRAYPALLKEPTLKAAFFGSMFSVAALDLVVTPADGKNKRDIEVAEFIRYYILGRRQTCLHLVESFGYEGRIQGFSVSHKKRKREDRGRWAGKIVIDEFKPKPVVDNRIMLEVDEFNNLTAIRSNWPNAPGSRFDPAHYVVFTYLRLFGSRTGMSDFRAARRACMFKEAAVKLRSILLDKFSGPFLKGTFTGTDNRTRQFLESAMSKARGQGWISVPAGCDVEIIDLAGRSTGEFKQAIEDLDHEIARALNFASLQMMTGKEGAQRGSAAVQQSQSEIGNWYVAALIAETLQTQVIPDGVNDNYGPEYDLPIVSIGSVNAADVLKDLEIDATLHDMGGPLDLSDLYRRAGRPVPLGAPDVLPGKTAPATLGQPNPDDPNKPGPPQPEPPIKFSDDDEVAALLRAVQRVTPPELAAPALPLPPAPIIVPPAPASPIHVHLPRPGKRKETQTVKRDGDKDIQETVTISEDVE